MSTSAERNAPKAATGSTLAKLVIFSISLGAAPLSTYFLSNKYFWNGNSTYAAISAVFAANVVLVTYIISSLLEDQKTAPAKMMETKKDQ